MPSANANPLEEKPVTTHTQCQQLEQRRVLTVGDGNFSYSLALAKAHKSGEHDTLQLTATSYDSYDELVAKYPECKRICAQLQELGATVLHRVDATNLRESLVAAGGHRELKFHSVVFNHPHCGEENVGRHQSLLSHFYASALEVLEENEEEEDSGVLLTLAEGQSQRWEAVQRARSAGLKLHRQVDDVDRDETFGLMYERKRHQNGKSFHLVTLHGEKKQQESTLFIFRRQEGDEAKAAAPVASIEKEAKVSRKRKAESELPLEFACTQCERSFKSAQGLRTHVHMVHELEASAPKKTLLPCEFCERTFKKEDARRQHQLAKHGKDPLIKPDWYEKQQAATTDSIKTAEAPALAETKVTAPDHTAPQPPKTCSICQLSFSSSEDFDAHWQKLQPRAAAKRKCANCSREFDEERALRQHQNFCSAAPFVINMSSAYASDGGSSTESEDESAYLQLKSEPNVGNPEPAAESSVVVKSEVVESHVIKQEEEPKQEDPILKTIKDEELKQEHSLLETIKEEEHKQEHPILETVSQHEEELEQTDPILETISQQEQEHATIPPCCSACGYPLLVVPQTEILKAKDMLDCKCCTLVLPDSSFSKKQRSETRKDFRKCKACTGNVNRGAKPLVQPTRQKPQVPLRMRNKKAEKRSHGASAVFTNKVGRLKMAKQALQRKRDEASKLKMTKRREEYEQQLSNEEKDLARQSALLKRENPGAFKSLMKDIQIKKPLTYEQEKKSKKKKVNPAKKKQSKRKADGATEQASKKRKGPVVDPSMYAPPASTVDEVPARVIPTRSRARAQPDAVQPQTVEMKSEVKAELPKVEIKSE